MIKIAICDDESFLLEKNKEIAESALKDLGCDYEIDAMSSGTELLDQYKSGRRYDILLLDYQMDDLTGVETAAEIRKTDTEVIIIFISSYITPAPKAFEVNAFRYVYRGADMKNDLVKALTLAVHKIRFDSHEYEIKTRSKDYHIPTKEISYLESYKRKIIAHTSRGNIEFYKSIEDVESELKDWGFIRVHRSYIVNVNHIQHMGRKTIIVRSQNDIELPISKNKRDEIIHQKIEYHNGENW